jgi:hypothetical protein
MTTIGLDEDTFEDASLLLFASDALTTKPSVSLLLLFSLLLLLNRFFFIIFIIENDDCEVDASILPAEQQQREEEEKEEPPAPPPPAVKNPLVIEIVVIKQTRNVSSLKPLCALSNTEKMK